ncbi:MAG: hypothetical protein L0L18_00310 [Acidipropionibacterium jensenii]|nr:hypothetical protein [Acidipropionibacterium jensenii]
MLASFGYVTSDQRSLLEEARMKSTLLEDLIPELFATINDPGSLYFDRSGTAIRFTSNPGQEPDFILGILDSVTIFAKVKPIPGSQCYQLKIGKKDKPRTTLMLPSSDLPKDSEAICSTRQRAGTEPSTIAIYGFFEHFWVQTRPNPRTDHFMGEFDSTDKHSFNLGGTVTSVRRERNSLTGANFWTISLDSVVPLVLLTDDTGKEIPKIGDVAYFRADIRFSRLFPLILPSIVSDSRQSEHLSDLSHFIPLDKQVVQHSKSNDSAYRQADDGQEDDDIGPVGSSRWLSAVYDIEEDIVLAIETFMNSAKLPDDILEEVVQEIPRGLDLATFEDSNFEATVVNTLRALGRKDEALKLARNYFEQSATYRSFESLLSALIGTSDRFMQQEMKWVEYVLSREYSPDGEKIRQHSAFRM